MENDPGSDAVVYKKHGQSKSDDESVEIRRVDKEMKSSKHRSSLRLTFRKSKPVLNRSASESNGQPQSENHKVFLHKLLSDPSSTNSRNSSKLGPHPAPLLVEDPPSSENDSDLENLRPLGDPALLNGSSGNFGSAGARSAPSTPQGVLGSSPTSICEPSSTPCSPGYNISSIQRSPSHSLFTKYDKGSLKQLSTSTPAMTAQAQSPEPPSPKSSKEDKHPVTSKARQKKFHRHFPSVGEDEKVLNYYSCALIGDILLQGHLYITKNYFAFHSNVFGYVTKLLIPILSVEKITKEKTARIIPNAIGIATAEEKHVFGSLMSRDNTYRYMNKVLEAARTASQIPDEPEILERIAQSETDSSETREGESERESPTSDARSIHKGSFKHTELLNNEYNKTDGLAALKAKAQTFHLGYVKLASMPRHNLLLFATTFLLVLLFFSAAVLLYRIGRVQDRYVSTLQENTVVTGSEDIYNELLHWQTTLHSKSAGAVHSFLDSNLDQIAKVRQSLEALSALLLPNRNGAPKDSTSKPQETTDNS